jgi:membrane-bound lytic murein transglycosylase A
MNRSRNKATPASTMKIHMTNCVDILWNLRTRTVSKFPMKRQFTNTRLLVTGAALVCTVLAGCASKPTAPDTSLHCPPAPVCAPCAAAPVCGPEIKANAPPLKPAQWSDLPGWANEEVTPAFNAFRQSCNAIGRQARWRAVCAAAQALAAPGNDEARAYFEQQFVPFQVVNPDSGTQGTITGYYEPLLNGSRERKPPYLYPLYAPPDDLLTIDLASVEPQLKGLHLRGRLEGNKVVPYLARADIEQPDSPLKGKELFYTDDEVELFFLQIQGSGRLHLDTGETIRVGYADQNGYPYKSIGRYLVEQGELKLEQASMQGIKAWGRAHPERLQELLNHNPSYVFFRVSASQSDAPLGALGIPLTPERSIAVDARVIPLGSPVFLATTLPDSAEPLDRLMLAQDTGGAIRGAVRADMFWGFGPAAGAQAGKMHQSGAMWVLVPKGEAVGDKR